MREVFEHLPDPTEEIPAHQHARDIMGNGFISIAEAVDALSNSRLSPEDLLKLLFIPFSEELLGSMADTHWLLPSLRNTSLFGSSGILCSSHSESKGLLVNKERTEIEWLLVSKRAVSSDQKRDLSPNRKYAPLSAAVLPYIHNLLRATGRDRRFVAVHGPEFSASIRFPIEDAWGISSVELPVFRVCHHPPNTTRLELYVVPGSYSGSFWFHPSIKPDLKP